MTKNKIAAAVILGLLMVFVLLIWFYHSIQSNQNQAKQQAKDTALAKSALVEADQVEAFNGNKSYMVVSGKDKAGQRLYVWVGEDEVHSELAKNGISKQQLQKKMLLADPEIDLIRLILGKFKGDYIWEAFYKKKMKDGTRYYYGYYNFADGTLLDKYNLSKMK